MNKEVRPETMQESPPQAETPVERVREAATEVRRKAEELGTVAQERAGELGERAGERTREAVNEVRYFSEQARSEAAARLEGTGRYIGRQANEVGEYSRETIRQHPGWALSFAALAGFALAIFGRRLILSMTRR